MFVRLGDGAVHDFQRRIGHFQHLQLGCLSDQFNTLRQDVQILQMELKKTAAVMEQQQATRNYGISEFRRELEMMRGQIKQEHAVWDQSSTDRLPQPFTVDGWKVRGSTVGQIETGHR